MTAPKWERQEGEESGHWWRYTSPSGWEFTIDFEGGEYRALFVAHQGGLDDPVGPIRKTRAAALNDCKRYARNMRAGLVAFGRAKL